jgi:predicted ATPase
LGLRERTGEAPADAVTDYVRDRSLLLVLDNLEQVTRAAGAIAALLAAAASLRILATSRSPLRIAAEHVFAVPPLAGADAVRLFVERARAARSDFAATGEDADAVSEVCAQLDGLPLAIELAAARMRVLSPRALLGRIDRRLPLLTGGGRERDLRQQTLRATIQWSYDLLSPAEQTLLSRLSVFVGGCRLDAAEAVCNPKGELGINTLEGLTSLLEQSLVRPWNDADGEPRFGMLETIREFAGEHEEAGVRDRHAEYFLAVARDGERGFEGPDWRGWRDRLQAEIDNIRAAMRRALDTSDGELALSLSSSLQGFLIEQWRPLEARDLLTSALGVATDQTSPKLRADALLARSRVPVRDGGDREDAVAALGRYRELGDTRGVAESLVALGFYELGARRLAAAGRRADEARHCLRVAGLDERLPRLMSLRMLAAPTFEEAHRRGQDTIRALRALGAVRRIGLVYANLAVFALEDDRPRDALSLAEQALEPATAAADETAIADAHGTEAHAALALGDLARAARAFTAELRICRRFAYFELVPEALLGVAAIAAERRDVRRSGLLAGAARAATDRRLELVYLSTEGLPPRIWKRHRRCRARRTSRMASRCRRRRKAQRRGRRSSRARVLRRRVGARGDSLKESRYVGGPTGAGAAALSPDPTPHGCSCRPAVTADARSSRDAALVPRPDRAAPSRSMWQLLDWETLTASRKVGANGGPAPAVARRVRSQSRRSRTGTCPPPERAPPDRSPRGGRLHPAPSGRADLREHSFHSRRRVHEQHARHAVAGIAEVMLRSPRNEDHAAGLGSVHVVYNVKIYDAVQEDEGLILRIVDMWRRPGLCGHKGLEHGERPAGLRTGQERRVCVAHEENRVPAARGNVHRLNGLFHCRALLEPGGSLVDDDANASRCGGQPIAPSGPGGETGQLARRWLLCSPGRSGPAGPMRAAPFASTRQRGSGQSHRPRHGPDSIEATVGSSGAPAAASPAGRANAATRGSTLDHCLVPGSVSPDLMRAHASSPRPCKSDTRCTGLDTDLPETTRCQFELTNVLLSI